MDREGKDAFDLMDEVEQKGLTVTLSFPIGMGYDFQEYIIYGSKTLIYSVVTIVRISKPLLFGRANPELETIIKTSRHAEGRVRID
jgi:peptide chain release factor 3